MRCQKHRGPFPLALPTGNTLRIRLAPGARQRPRPVEQREQRQLAGPTRIEGQQETRIVRASHYKAKNPRAREQRQAHWQRLRLRSIRPTGRIPAPREARRDEFQDQSRWFRESSADSAGQDPHSSDRPGWRTYGKYYDVEKDEESVEITLELAPPPHWY